MWLSDCRTMSVECLSDSTVGLTATAAVQRPGAAAATETFIWRRSLVQVAYVYTSDFLTT